MSDLYLQDTPAVPDEDAPDKEDADEEDETV